VGYGINLPLALYESIIAKSTDRSHGNLEPNELSGQMRERNKTLVNSDSILDL
jgi:hypothetical protein